MIASILAKNNSFGIAPEVFMVGPLMMVCETLLYYSGRTYHISGAFSEEKSTPQRIAFLHRVFYGDKRLYPQYANLDYEYLLNSYLELRKINRPDKKDLVALQRGKRILDMMEKDVGVHYRHYVVQYGFQFLKPFFLEGSLRVDSEPLPMDQFEREDHLLSYLTDVFTGNSIAVMNQRMKKVLKMEFAGAGPEVNKGDAIGFPFLTFPVLKRLTEAQGISLHQNLKEARKNFNGHLEELNKKLTGEKFSIKNFKHYAALMEEHLAEDQKKLNKVLDNNVFINQIKNSADDGVVNLSIGVSSVENLMDCYRELGLMDKQLNKMLREKTESVSPDQAMLFLYCETEAPEMRGEVN